MSGVVDGGNPTGAAEYVHPWIALLMRLQAELNALSSVAIEEPSLRPAAEKLREALDG